MRRKGAGGASSLRATAPDAPSRGGGAAGQQQSARAAASAALPRGAISSAGSGGQLGGAAAASLSSSRAAAAAAPSRGGGAAGQQQSSRAAVSAAPSSGAGSGAGSGGQLGAAAASLSSSSAVALAVQPRPQISTPSAWASPAPLGAVVSAMDTAHAQKYVRGGCAGRSGRVSSRTRVFLVMGTERRAMNAHQLLRICAHARWRDAHCASFPRRAGQDEPHPDARCGRRSLWPPVRQHPLS